MEVGVRKLIAGMKMSLDGKVAPADWVQAWSDDYGLMPQIDACVLGGGMYPEYEQYWTAIQNEPKKPILTESPPTPAEVEFARFAAQTPHYVLSRTLSSTLWPQTVFVREPKEIAALKQKPGKDIYLVGGRQTTASFIDAGLVDELRLIVYPLVAHDGKALFETTERRHGLELRNVEQLPNGRVGLIYTTAS
jgi:dihydrofolate reductase